MQRSIIAPAERVTNLRWGMLAVVAAVVLGGSVHGATMWFSGPPLFDRDACAIAFAVALVPLGLALDRFGARAVGSIAAALWAVCALLAAAGVPAAILPASIGSGIAGAAFLPMAAKAIASWFPRSERGRATAIVIAASILGVFPFTIPFVDGAIFSTLAAIAFAIVYRDPDERANLTYAERTFITAGGAQPVVTPALPDLLATIARDPAVWATAFAFGAFGYAYGATVFQLWLQQNDAIAVVVALVAGFAVDALARRADATRVRKTVLVVGTLCACAPLAIAHASLASVIAVPIVIALAGYAAALPVAWSLPGFIAPAGGAGTVAAAMGLAGAIGFAVPRYTGSDPDGMAAAAVIGALCYAFALRRIDPAPAAGMSI